MATTGPSALIEKITALPPDLIAEVEDFVDSIVRREQDCSLVSIAAGISASAFATVWNNPEDDVYDPL